MWEIMVQVHHVGTEKERKGGRPILLHNIHWSSVIEIRGLSFSVKVSLRGQIVTVTD